MMRAVASALMSCFGIFMGSIGMTIISLSRVNTIRVLGHHEYPDGPDMWSPLATDFPKTVCQTGPGEIHLGMNLLGFKKRFISYEDRPSSLFWTGGRL